MEKHKKSLKESFYFREAEELGPHGNGNDYIQKLKLELGCILVV